MKPYCPRVPLLASWRSSVFSYPMASAGCPAGGPCHLRVFWYIKNPGAPPAIFIFSSPSIPSSLRLCVNLATSAFKNLLFPNAQCPVPSPFSQHTSPPFTHPLTLPANAGETSPNDPVPSPLGDCLDATERPTSEGSWSPQQWTRVSAH